MLPGLGAEESSVSRTDAYLPHYAHNGESIGTLWAGVGHATGLEARACNWMVCSQKREGWYCMQAFTWK